MIFDRLDGSKTNLPGQNPLGILRQAGLDITISDNVATLDFSDVGGYGAAGKYREAFLQLRTEGMERTQQSGAIVEIETKPGSNLDSHVTLPAYVLGTAIQSKDLLGQAADALMDDLANKQPAAAMPAVAGASGFAVTPAV